MSVEERLMAPGRWDLSLVEDTPYSIRRNFNPGNHIIVTPAPVDESLQTLAFLLSVSHHTGVLLARERRTISGQGLLFYLGTNERGQVVDPTGWADNNLDFETWIRHIMKFGGVSGFDVPTGPYTEGSIHAIGSDIFTLRTGGQFRKQLLETICTIYGGEYRVNHDNTFDAGTAADLFVTSPSVVAMPHGDVGDHTYESLKALELDPKVDASDLQTGWYVLGAGEGNTAVVDESNALPWAEDLLGQDLWLTEMVSAPDAATTAEAAAIGAGRLTPALFKATAVTLSTDTYAIGRYDAKPGDTIYVYNPDDRLFDLTTQLEHGGTLIFPLPARVMAVSWPVEVGMGVYHHVWHTGEIVDITDWVDWEDGPTSFELRAPKRPLVPKPVSPVVERRLR